jgi:rhodanese-related sulfurtransferase
MSGGGERKVDLTYDEIVDLKSRDEIILVDVRDNNEIEETGQLPGSIHIPCKYQISQIWI